MSTTTEQTAPGSAAPDRGAVELELSRTNTPVSWLLRHEHELRDHVALRWEGEGTTYGELAERVRSTAGVLADHGVARGDRVILLSPNRSEFVHVTLAVFYLGAIVVPVNFRLAPGEVSYLIDNAEPAVMVVDGGLLPLALEAVRSHDSDLPIISLDPRTDGGLSLRDLTPTSRPVPVVVQHADDAAIMYTSGTTGRPKGAVLTHGNFSSNALRTAKAWGVDDSDTVMVASPLFHIAAFCAYLGHLVVGARALIMPSSAFDATEILDAMESEGVTTTFLVPAQWQLLCDEPRVSERDLALHYMSWGAAPATEALLRRMMKTFTGAGVVAAFGQTETTASGVALPAADALTRVGSVGRPTYGFSIRVVDGAMNDVPVGEVGEIVYRGTGVMSRYWRNEEATAEAFHGGWFHSGDLVRQDEDGFLYVVDRIKDMIISGGENIYCAELENVIADHPKVAQVAVVGRADDRWGEVPVAVVVQEEGSEALTLDEIRDFCDGRLARYKLPKDLIVRGDFPRSGTGKILKSRLRDEV